jgi:hypothetical protein
VSSKIQLPDEGPGSVCAKDVREKRDRRRSKNLFFILFWWFFAIVFIINGCFTND